MIDKRETYFQKNLKALLVNQGLKYKEFAELCDLSEDAVKSYFRFDAALPNAKTLEKIAAQFNLQYDDLLQADFDMLFQESLEKASPKIKFRNAMIEVGYDEVIAMIDYLQFTGYQISFYADEVKYGRIRTDEAEKQFDILQQKNENIYLQKKQELIEIENEMEQMESLQEREEISEQIEEISRQYFEAEMELINIEFCLSTMNNKSKKKNVDCKIGMNRAIGMMGELGKLPPAIRKRRLKELGMYVILYIPDEADDYKKVDIYDFYMLCESINNNIAEKIAGM